MIYKKFKGTESQYTVLHNWVRSRLGRPSLCENCGTTVAARFEWANVSDNYLKDESDWVRLCSRCHRYIDGLNVIYDKVKTHCFRGHEFTKENSYVRPGGTRQCRKCRQIYELTKPYLRKKELRR